MGLPPAEAALRRDGGQLAEHLVSVRGRVRIRVRVRVTVRVRVRVRARARVRVRAEHLVSDERRVRGDIGEI